MRQMVKMAQEAAVCDSTVRYQENEINKGLKAQVSGDSLLDVRTKELQASQKEAALNIHLYDVETGLTQEAKKQKWKWVKIAIVAIVVVTVETIMLIASLSK